MMKMWREDRPTLRNERDENQKDTFLVQWQFGLAGIAAEAEDPGWARQLTEQEAELACRYAPLELNGFPSWLEGVAIAYPGAVARILGEELSHSLRETLQANYYSTLLQNCSNASPIVVEVFVPRIRTWLEAFARTDATPKNSQFEQNLRQAIEILLKYGNGSDRAFVETTSTQKLAGGLAVPFVNVWLSALLSLNPAAGVDALENGLRDRAVLNNEPGVRLLAPLFGYDHGGNRDLNLPEFTPRLLLRLVRLAYQHVPVEDDTQDEGDDETQDDMKDSRGVRRDAERARDVILSALLATTGPDGWSVKIEMAADPLFGHFKDRVIALAEAKAAEEADNAVLTETEFAVLDKNGEAPPPTTEAMFSLMHDRLDDIDDLLLQDISPRELWASITDEHLMRRELARVLRDAANHSYTIDQESVTAEEKETDIRFRSTGSKQQGTIELKLGDERSGSDLFNTIKDQLLTKYMAADDCRAGCLLVTIARDRNWEHPKTGKKIDFEALIGLLNEEAERLSKELGGTARLMAKGLDLRPRLPPERTSLSKPG